MKALFLYLSLFGLVWAQSELKPRYKKPKEKCMNEHQITVKGRDAKHKYYLFHYIYSSLMPSNQTWIKKEEVDSKSISGGQLGLEKERGLRDPIDNHTAEGKEESHKNLVEKGKDGGSEDSAQHLNGHNENPSNRDIFQHHLEFIVVKGRNYPVTDDTAGDIDGSGDMGFLSQDERHPGTISGNGHQNQGKDHPDMRGTETNSLEERKEAGQSGIADDTKLSKDTHVKTGMKESDISVIQETNPHSYTPKKSEESKSKVYLDVSMKIKNATSNKPGKEEGGYSDLLDKGKGGNASAKLQTHFNVQGKISEDLFGKWDHRRNGSISPHFPVTDEIKTVNEKVINNTRVHKKGDNEYAALNQKLDRRKDVYEETKPHQKGEMRDNITRSKRIESADIIKPHKKLGEKYNDINGKPISHIDVAGILKTHRTGEGAGITGRSISQVENPSFTPAGKLNQTNIISSGRLNGSGVTKSHIKSRGDVSRLGRVFVSQESGSHARNHSRKGTTEVGIIHRKSNNKIQGFHFTSTRPKKADSRDIIIRNAHGGKQGDPEMQEKGNLGAGITFQEGNKEVKGNISYHKAHGNADIGIDSSIRKEEKRGRKPVRIKNALTLAHGSHRYKHIAKSQEHSFHTLKSGRKLTEPSRKRSRSRGHSGRHSSTIAKQYPGHLGSLERERSRHDRKSKSRKHTHARDSSQSSESEENSRNDSHQSYEDYPNDNPDVDQSSESMEEDLSARSKQRDDRSQMGDIYSHEDSLEHRSN